ncbi:competence protein ComEC [Paracoccus sulfuroxidans]|uniref:Competence protein ComEC n=2 Tax=Paracoccus sulfuroxidans TaxID=384678 RepID=A0A562NAY6_9RHOB|nr:competence protein ComEC [Paracoccus sulfuroxidans]
MTAPAARSRAGGLQGAISRSRSAARSPVARRSGMLPWVPFWMALGIGGWLSLKEEPGLVFYMAVAAFAVAVLAVVIRAPRWAERGRIGWDHADWLRLCGMALALIAGGVLLIGGRAHLVAAPVLEFRYYGPIEGRVVGIDRSSRDRMRLLLDQVVLRDMAPARTPRKVQISLLQEDELPQPGQRVMLTGHLGPPGGPSEPGGFDFRRSAWFRGLGAIGYSRNPVMTVAAPEEGGVLSLHRLRMQMSQAMQDQIGGQSGAVASALMTGDRSGIIESTNDVMRASNLYHIISISGLHMSMLAGFIYAGLRLVAVLAQLVLPVSGWPVHKIAAGGAILASAAYLWLSGGGVATERSFIMVAIMLCAVLCDRRAISLRTVSVAAVCILAYAPEALVDAGFQMSFAATVGLILAAGPWTATSQRLHWLLRPVAMLVMSSFVAGMVTSPIAAAHFGRMSQYGLLANMLVVPVMGAIVMPAGVIAALLAPIGLAGIPLRVMGMGTDWMLMIAAWVASLGGSVTLIAAPPPVVLPLMGAGGMLLALTPLGRAHLASVLARCRLGLAVALLAGAAVVWTMANRPLVLISAEGDAVGVMTPEGRAPSKARGGSYAVTNWLEADGDGADQQTAALRPAWTGAANLREVELEIGGQKLRILHATGRAADPAKLPCDRGMIVVANKPLTGLSGECTVLDPPGLRQSGAQSVVAAADGTRLRSQRDVGGQRLWAAPAKKRAVIKEKSSDMVVANPTATRYSRLSSSDARGRDAIADQSRAGGVLAR